MKKTKFLLIMLIMVSLIFFSCSKDSTGPKNDKPDEPSNPSPADNSTNISISQTLNWSCSDPDDDPLTYDVYFGESTAPPIVNDGQSSTTYDPGTLNYETTYYWKIVAEDDNSNSTTGDVWEFTTTSGGTGTVTDIDGNVYQTIQIGDQEWMMENIEVTHYNNGDTIPEVTGNNTWIGLTTGAYCNYGNNNAYVSIYGRLYNWYSVDDSRGIAPDGWHVPTDDDWQILVDYLGGSSVAGGKMKSTGTIEGGNGLWHEPNTGATNESGFTALPGGYRDSYEGGIFYSFGYHALFWSSTEYQSNNSCERELFYHNSMVSSCNSYYIKNEGFSIRCIKN
ncbi:MAG: fibrobacter succinogenes major paralogous domain-containing protein [Mariniphaga sp.]|nr:fibrobacter succinogenes major paralogous domain-containing protein [Mariniphaga sp.]